MRLLADLPALLLVTSAAWLPFHADALPLSKDARAAFVRAHPCPATGKPRGACPGWVVDHVTPLCAGGADSPANMQWQTTADATRKDKTERAMCRKQY